MAGVHELILRLPEGYETPIGERGAALSGGQRQRLALARAIFRKPRLLVLDEPNANLDTDGENALLKSVAQLKADGHTVVLISHRPALLKAADQIMVLQEGRISAFDDADKVLAQFGKSEPRPAIRQVHPTGSGS